MNEQRHCSVSIDHMPFGKALPFVKADGVALQPLILDCLHIFPEGSQLRACKDFVKVLWVGGSKVCKKQVWQVQGSSFNSHL